MIAQSVGGMEIVVGMSSLAGGLVLDKSELVQGSELPINYFFTSTPMPLTSNVYHVGRGISCQGHSTQCSQRDASSVGKLVQLVTASRLILYHEGRVDPMKDECHYQIKH